MKIPYGSAYKEINIEEQDVSVFKPQISNQNGKLDDRQIVKQALGKPLNGKNIKISDSITIGIGINDQSRPIPHHVILPALMEFLIESGAKKELITFYIATGTHNPVGKELFPLILTQELIDDYKIVSHDCDYAKNLVKLGITTRNTPVFINKSYYEADLKIVVGNIESHHFMGFSGGYKTASIGLASRETITANHALLPDPNARMGLFSTNPMRREVEEIGRMIGVDFALNVVISPDKRILSCYWGSPGDVIRCGVQFIRDHIQMELGDVLHQFDLVIASPGGYPKDINFYQSQKALTHACLFAKQGGQIILAAECRDGFGSERFEEFVSNHSTADEIIREFESKDFEIGPHKAYQLAKQALNHRITLVSEMTAMDVRRLKLVYQPNMQTAIDEVIARLPEDPRVALLPYATHTMPKIRE